jgi:hypothetical protein
MIPFTISGEGVLLFVRGNRVLFLKLWMRRMPGMPDSVSEWAAQRFQGIFQDALLVPCAAQEVLRCPVGSSAGNRPDV